MLCFSFRISLIHSFIRSLASACFADVVCLYIIIRYTYLFIHIFFVRVLRLNPFPCLLSGSIWVVCFITPSLVSAARVLMTLVVLFPCTGACVRALVRACVHTCVRAFVPACVCVYVCV